MLQGREAPERIYKASLLQLFGFASVLHDASRRSAQLKALYAAHERTRGLTSKLRHLTSCALRLHRRPVERGQHEHR